MKFTKTVNRRRRTPVTINASQVIVEQKVVTVFPRRLDPGRVADLRRRVDREVADLLIARAPWVTPEERALVLAVYRDGLRLREFGAFAPCAPKTLRQRLKRAVTRMLSPRFAFVLMEREHWSPMRRRIADECVLRGRSMRETAGALGLSLHAVRRHMEFISAMESAREAERAA